jgi:lysyl-tRNA synthetase class 2
MADKGEKHRQQNKDTKEPQMREVDGKKEYLDEETNEWVSKNELKKRQTKRKKDAEAAAKADKKAQEPQKPGKKKPDADAEDEKDPSKYTDIRKKMLQDLRKEGKEVYPHKFQKDMTIPQFRE